MLAVGECSGEACGIPPGSLRYGATPAGNAFMLAAFAALIPPVIYAGFRYRTIAHTSLLLTALAFEVIGHVGKIFLAANPTSHAYSTLYLLGTHWGAILIGSAANLVLPHAMVIYGEEFRLVSDPVYLNILFFILDIFALAFQSVGIGFASTAHTSTEVSQGVSILLTGLAIQAVNLLAFLGTYRYFRYKLSHRRYILDDRYSLVYQSRRFTYFMICIQVVAALLLLRTAVRIAIFADGLDSAFATSQVTTFLLDDTIVLVAVLIIAICPPGRAFGGAWAATSPMATSPDRPHTLPLRLRRHRRNRSSRINKRVISLPYTSPSASPRFSPGYTPRGGMTPGLPAHPSPRAPPLISPLMSPRNNPVHQRAPYELSPTQEVPYMAPQESPGMDSSMWMASPPVDHGRKRRMRAGSGPEPNQMVDGDALWS
ncbi:RTA1 like protein-domain-containing protein [Chaetomium tenue]|uniref:RTA1 like protein-domain-containing protein n=1 Tax=Chaetomium tenue TaxID=1854479 RepID=A0ACB7NZ96_9PEZI|nr:RTA1 like protein-domain-containing protein [Chaetomium globosum]